VANVHAFLVKGISQGIQEGNAKNSRSQRKHFFSTLERLSIQPFSPELKTHKLHGKLAGLWACEVEYDCRIVFTFETDPHTGKDLIVLADIGNHNEVY
jgi:mRNA interferase YafQ